MKYMVRYQIAEEGGYTGQCLELPAAISQGETLEELRKNISDAIQLVLEDMIEESREKKDNIITLEIPA